MAKKCTALSIKNRKGKERIASVALADYTSACLAAESGIEMLLVGDSLGMTMLGYTSTLPVTLDEMIMFTKAVVRGAPDALVIADMPFMSYQVSGEQLIQNAGRVIKESGADAIKLEGGGRYSTVLRSLIDIGVPVMGHIGLTPQSVKAMGGFKVQGRKSEDAERLIQDAIALDQAGIFSLVLECVPAELATEISSRISCPTIGIGAGAGCDGQILVFQDMVGQFRRFCPKFVKQYAQLGDATVSALQQYKSEVENGLFPTIEHSF